MKTYLPGAGRASITAAAMLVALAATLCMRRECRADRTCRAAPMCVSSAIGWSPIAAA